MSLNMEEIVKVLECCKEHKDDCTKCTYLGSCIEGDSKPFIVDDILPLIKSLEAANKALQRHNDKYSVCTLVGNALVYTETIEDYDKLIGSIKSEARREFAEKLKEKAETELYADIDPVVGSYECEYRMVDVEDIDEILDNFAEKRLG